MSEDIDFQLTDFEQIEFVRDKQTKEPFRNTDGVAEGIHHKGKLPRNVHPTLINLN